MFRKKKRRKNSFERAHPWLIGLHVLAPWAFKRHFHFVVFYLLIFISCCDARFEKLQEDAFTYAFILKSLNMIPALGNWAQKLPLDGKLFHFLLIFLVNLSSREQVVFYLYCSSLPYHSISFAILRYLVSILVHLHNIFRDFKLIQTSLPFSQ